MTSTPQQLLSCLPHPPSDRERPVEAESGHSSQLPMTYKRLATDDTAGCFASVRMITGNC